MKKHIITEQVQKDLDYIASRLSPEHFVFRGGEKMKGHEMILTGYADQVDKNDLDKEYCIPVPVVHEVNHKRRLRKAFLKGGDAGVKAYLEQLYKARVARDTVDKPMAAVKSILKETL